MFVLSFIVLVVLKPISNNMYVSGDLIIKPKNTEVVVGQSVSLHCSTSIPSMEVHWQHRPHGNISFTYVYYNRKTVNGYNTRFSVNDDQTNGNYDLMIRNAQISDAGTYRCHDRVGSGEHMDVELIVLTSEPNCEASNLSFWKETSGALNISCSVQFVGGIRPDIYCSSQHICNSSAFKTVDLPQRVNYTFQSVAHWSGMKKFSILCQTSLSNISSTINVKTPSAVDSSSSTTNVSSESGKGPDTKVLIAIGIGISVTIVLILAVIVLVIRKRRDESSKRTLLNSNGNGSTRSSGCRTSSCHDKLNQQTDNAREDNEKS